MMGMQFFYMKHDFYAGQFTKTAFPLFEGFNEKVALWFISWFYKSTKKYLGVLVRDFEKTFYETELEVPYYGEQLALDFIESRVRELEEERVRELEAYLTASNFSDCSLTLAEKNALNAFEEGTIFTKSIKIGKLFDIYPTKSYGQTNATLFATRGDVPVIVNSSADNGVGGWIALNPTEKGNMITFSDTTTSDAIFYQPFDFVGYSHVQGLHPKEPSGWTENAYLYFLSLFKKSANGRFDYATKFTRYLAMDMEVEMPISSEGDIDFCFMENYISAVKKQIIVRLKEFIEREHKAYMQAIDSQEESIEQTIMPLRIHDTYQPGRIPLYTLRAACGYFDDGQLPEAEGWIDASGLGFTPDKDRYFAVHAKGDSMLPKIHDGDICIFEWYHAGSRNGEIVLSQSSEYDDAYGGRYTIKRYYSEKAVTDEGWQHTKVELQPLNPDFEPIVLSEDDPIRTIGIFKCVM